MKKHLLTLLFALASLFSMAQQQLPKPYNEELDAMEQIAEAVAQAKQEGKNVMCQVGGNWCIWCLRFANYVSTEEEVAKFVADNFVYIHVNYSPNNKNEKAMEFFGNPKLGYPFFAVLDAEGKLLLVHDSGSLEQEKSYDKEKVMAFFTSCAPSKE